MKVYFISGLGANSKAFKFLDLSFCEPVFIEWFPPLRNETLEHYALRTRDKMPEEHPTVVGVSFGGMLATEMAKNDPLMKVIIISSSKTADEFPAYLRVWKNFPLYKWVPGNVIKLGGKLSTPIMGPKGKEQKKLFKQIIRETNPDFNSWAIDAILNWKNKVIPKNVVHIHGKADTLLPFKLVKADYTIDHGTHLMIMDKADELSILLKRLLTTPAA